MLNPKIKNREKKLIGRKTLLRIYAKSEEWKQVKPPLSRRIYIINANLEKHKDTIKL